MFRAFFGHHKAATTWISLILNDVAAALDLRTLTVHSSVGWARHDSLVIWPAPSRRIC